jgi:hypothetical protein
MQISNNLYGAPPQKKTALRTLQTSVAGNSMIATDFPDTLSQIA